MVFLALVKVLQVGLAFIFMHRPYDQRNHTFDDLRSATKMGGEPCPTGRANFVSTKSSETFP
jgi:hypothetical protein